MSKEFKIKLIFYIIICDIISKLMLDKVELIKFNCRNSVGFNMIIYSTIHFLNSYFICSSYKNKKNNTSK